MEGRLAAARVPPNLPRSARRSRAALACRRRDPLEGGVSVRLARSEGECPPGGHGTPWGAVPRRGSLEITRLNEERTDGQRNLSRRQMLGSRRAAWRWRARRTRRARRRGQGGGGRRAVPQGLRLGRGDGRLSGRGRGHRGRQGAVGVGRLLQEEGRGLRREHGRRRLRPLPPLQGRRRAHEDAGREVVPLQRLLAARAAERGRRLEPEGARLLQPPPRRAADARDRAASARSSTGTTRRRSTRRAAG